MNDSKYSADDRKSTSPRDADNVREAVTRAAKQIDLDEYDAADLVNLLAFHGWELRKS